MRSHVVAGSDAASECVPPAKPARVVWNVSLKEGGVVFIGLYISFQGGVDILSILHWSFTDTFP